MKKVAIVFWSASGNTEALANAIAAGVTAAGAESTLFPCADFSADSVANFDAFAFGCPASGSEELDENEFAPLWESVKDTLGDKKVVLFGSYGWGGGEWMDTWKSESEGVNIVGDCICEGEPDDEALAKCTEVAALLA